MPKMGRFSTPWRRHILSSSPLFVDLEKVSPAMKRQWTAMIAAVMLLGCTKPEDSSFGVQAARRGENCSAIATGSAMDAYGHGVGPAEDVYENVKQDCLAWQKREKERLNASQNR